MTPDTWPGWNGCQLQRFFVEFSAAPARFLDSWKASLTPTEGHFWRLEMSSRSWEHLLDTLVVGAGLYLIFEAVLYLGWG